MICYIYGTPIVNYWFLSIVIGDTSSYPRKKNKQGTHEVAALSKIFGYDSPFALSLCSSYLVDIHILLRLESHLRAQKGTNMA